LYGAGLKFVLIRIQILGATPEEEKSTMGITKIKSRYGYGKALGRYW
jgi:hypothetical protein